MRKLIYGLLASTLLFTAFAQAEEHPGAKLYIEKTCATCHGEKGNKPLMPSYPVLAGQSAEYAFQQLKDFKSGARSNGQAAVMKGIMAMVSEEEMKALSEYLQSLGQESQPDAAKAETESAESTE